MNHRFETWLHENHSFVSYKCKQWAQVLRIALATATSYVRGCRIAAERTMWTLSGWGTKVRLLWRCGFVQSQGGVPECTPKTSAFPYWFRMVRGYLWINLYVVRGYFGSDFVWKYTCQCKYRFSSICTVCAPRIAKLWTVAKIRTFDYLWSFSWHSLQETAVFWPFPILGTLLIRNEAVLGDGPLSWLAAMVDHPLKLVT